MKQKYNSVKAAQKIPIIRATVFAKDNAADLLLQKVTQYAKKLWRDQVYSKNVQLVPKLASTHNKLTLVTAHSHSKNALMRRTQQKLLTPSEYRSAGRIG